MKALITGSYGGIGKAITYKLLDEGITCVCPTHKEMDLISEASIQNFLKKDIEYDIFIHAAGSNTPGTVEDSHATTQDWNVNATSFMSIVRKLIPYWKQFGGGNVVALSSLYGVMSRKNRFPYTVSKHALIGAVQSMALDLAQYNVKVNAVCPGFVGTEMTHRNNAQYQITNMINNIPMGRLGNPWEIAELVLFLCTRNTYITGQNIIIDGGYSVGGMNGN